MYMCMYVLPYCAECIKHCTILFPSLCVFLELHTKILNHSCVTYISLVPRLFLPPAKSLAAFCAMCVCVCTCICICSCICVCKK